MLTPSRSIVGILDFPKQMMRNSGRAVIPRQYPSAIHSRLGNAEMEDAPAAHARDCQAQDKAHDKALPQRTSSLFNILFPSNDSKLDCLRENSVSFCAPTGIDPVGAGQYPKVRCRRKRLPTPEGEKRQCQISISTDGICPSR